MNEKAWTMWVADIGRFSTLIIWAISKKNDAMMQQKELWEYVWKQQPLVLEDAERNARRAN